MVVTDSGCDVVDTVIKVSECNDLVKLRKGDELGGDHLQATMSDD